MEIIIGIVIILVGLAVYFNRKPKPVATPSEEVPYKVEAPVVEEAPAPAPVVEEAPAKKTKKAPAKKTAAKKTASKATVSKKPRAKKTKAE